MTATFQPMPDLAPEQYDALKADIQAHGIIVPIVVDQHGRVLDGHNRKAIAVELGIECPAETRHVVDDDEAADLAVTLNCARRHLTQEQKRDLIGAELHRRWDDSDRAIARRVGSSPTTVGTVRSELRQEAEECTQKARDELVKARDSLTMAAVMMHRGHGFDRGYSWQSVGDLLERQEGSQLSNLDTTGTTANQVADAFIGDLVGGWFDSIRAFALDCDPDCPTCTPADREWAEAHPGQVYRHSDPPVLVSNLDSQVGGAR